jgi:tRNA nucleotidyltransferase (CCA-adding enzyme)
MQVLTPSDATRAFLTHETNVFIKQLKQVLQKSKLSAQVFVGGSFAKGTLVVKEVYDVDIFIRMKQVTPATIDSLERALALLTLPFTRVHGSRDYFQIPVSSSLIFELVPVKAIARPAAMENVTDLSYFHVSYVQKQMTKKLGQEIALAKAFCASAGVYGAESYINGFSGYALECLLIRYKTFNAFLKTLGKVKGTLIIDPAKHYRSSGELMREMNESRRSGPLIIVDPTWKQRNVAAALSHESFARFQQRAGAYLKKAHERFFQEEVLDVARFGQEAHKQKGHLLTLSLETEKQAGDIAGTKLKKVHRLVVSLLSERFTLLKEVFQYGRGQTSTSYFILTQKEVVQQGPLLSMIKHAQAFKKLHPKALVKKGRYHVTLPSLSPEAYLTQKLTKRLLSQMDISRMKLD